MGIALRVGPQNLTVFGVIIYRAACLPYKDFQQRTFIGLALANVSEYLGVLWVILGGAFALSVPLFAGTATVILLFSLPSVLRRKTAIKTQSRYGS